MEENKELNETIASKQESEQEKSTSKDGDKNMLAVLCYLGILLVIPLIVAKDDDFVKYHAKQGLVLLLAWVSIFFVAWIPILGWLFGFVAWIICFILLITGVINVVKGEKKPLAIIGKYADKFKI